jgi:membrane protein required for colicin V production
MIIDIIFIILMIIAVMKGLKNGFIVAVFSFIAIFIGLVAAMKFSVLVAGWLKSSTNITAAWLPFLSFVIVMIGVILLVRLGAVFIQKTMEMVMLGWLNKLSGIILYAALYITVLSVLLFYAEKVQLLKSDTIAGSQVYTFIRPWAPKAIEMIGALIPFCKGMFEDLSHFFDKVIPNMK